tara:strand:- start:4583 stop:6121 length:1539 start_codon:yes stop_codon:yes gene_type:complete
MREYSKDPVEAVAQHLLDTSEIKLKGKSLYMGSSRASNITRDIVSNDALLDELGIFRYVKSSGFNSRDFNLSVIDMLKDHLDKAANEEAFSLLEDTDEPQIDPNIFKIYKDIEEESDRNDKDKFLVLKADHSIVKNVAISTYRHLVTEEVYTKIRSKIPLAYKKYNPYKINENLQDKKWMEYVESIKMELPHINECMHPSWRYNRDKDAKLTEEEIFFIESSFTSKSDLQYYIDSAYHTVIDKMWSYIMLFGIKGTGKTTLIEMMIPCVGRDNYRKAPQNALKKEFNGFKKNKRLILMDEMVANTDTAVNILKSDANKEFNVEEKSQISESVQNFVSMWIATNNISDWKFTHDERRFSVLGLTTKTTLERGISDDWMGEFSQKIETEYWANAFFNYLEANRSREFNTMSPYKSEAFWEVVYESLSAWQMQIVDTITLGEPMGDIKISSLFDEHDKYAPSTHKKIIDFLDNYRHKGDKLGNYIRGRSVSSSSIRPNEKYMAPVNDNMSLNKEL